MYTIKVQKDYDGNIGRYVKLPLKLQCSFRDQLTMMWRKMQTISPKILIHWFKIKTFSTCLLDFDELFEEYFQIVCKKYYWSWLLYMHITYKAVTTDIHIRLALGTLAGLYRWTDKKLIQNCFHLNWTDVQNKGTTYMHCYILAEYVWNAEQLHEISYKNVQLKVFNVI